MYVLTFAALLLALSASGCYTPGLSVCDDPSIAGPQVCDTAANGRWTFRDGTLIGNPITNTTLINGAKKSNCYCQLAGGWPAVVREKNVVLTQCFGTNNYIGGPYNREPIRRAGYAYWWDGAAWINSGWNGVEPPQSYMQCDDDLGYSSDYAPSRNGTEFVLIDWKRPQPVLEGVLPSNAAATDTSMCPGFDAQAFYHPNPDAGPPITANDAVECTCSAINTVLISNDAKSKESQGTQIGTICSSDLRVYWNGKAYRRARTASRDPENDAFLISDRCTSRKYSNDMVIANLVVSRSSSSSSRVATRTSTLAGTYSSTSANGVATTSPAPSATRNGANIAQPRTLWLYTCAGAIGVGGFLFA